MRLTKRDMLKSLGVAGLFATLPSIAGCSAVASRRVYPGALSNLKSLITMAVPRSASERQTRIEKAQRLLQDFGFGALLLESGSALTYSTGIR